MAEASGRGAVHRVQASSEGVKLTGHVKFRGRLFRLGPCDAVAPMLDFAQAAARGLETDDPAGLAAMKDMIEGCFLLHPSCGTCKACADERYEECPQRDPGDFPKFWRLVRAVGSPAEELMEVVQAATEQALARPTPAPSGSSSPGRSKSAKSKAPSSLPPAFQQLPPGDLIEVADAIR